MLAPLFGYFLSMIAMLTAAVVVLTSFSNISTKGHARQHLRPPVIGRIDAVEVQPHSQVAKEETPAKDVSPVVATAKADTKKIKITNPKFSPVSATTTAMGTLGVMHLGMARVVSFSADRPQHPPPVFLAHFVGDVLVFARGSPDSP